MCVRTIQTMHDGNQFTRTIRVCLPIAHFLAGIPNQWCIAVHYIIHTGQTVMVYVAKVVVRIVPIESLDTLQIAVDSFRFEIDFQVDGAACCDCIDKRRFGLYAAVIKTEDHSGSAMDSVAFFTFMCDFRIEEATWTEKDVHGTVLACVVHVANGLIGKFFILTRHAIRHQVGFVFWGSS